MSSDPGLPPPEALGDEPVRLGRRRDPEPEWVEVHTGRESWRPPRWTAWFLAIAVVVCGVAWYADHQVRVREADDVARCAHRLSQASAMSELRMGALVDYLQPALSSTKGTQRLRLADLMAQPAHRVLPLVQRANRVCESVAVKPWHFTLIARRDAEAAYSSALVTLLQAVAAQGRAYFHDDSTLLRLRREAGIDGPGPG